jgi:23S rRNA pseudouridine955/2504/2580 synthase
MKAFTISPQDDGMRTNRFIERVAPSMPASLMYRCLRTKRIKLNGKRCEAASRLKAGDLLELYVGDEFFLAPPGGEPDFLRASRELDIVYEDGNIAILRKPAGLLCHGAGGDWGDTLVARFARYLFEKGEYSPGATPAFTPALCHRLDRGTEGLTAAAKNSAALSCMNGIIREGRASKLYLCAVSGPPPPDGGHTAYLLKDAGSNISSISPRPLPGSREISTSFRTLARSGGLSLVEANLLTGRPHQIRAHLAHLGCPIIGDWKYGSKAVNLKYGLTRQALCAFSIAFSLNPQLDAPLFSLDKREFRLKPESIWFVERYFPEKK